MDSSFVSIAFVCVPRGQELGSMCGDCRNHRARLPHWLTARQLGHSLASLSSLDTPAIWVHWRAPNALCCMLHQLDRCQCITYLPARPYATVSPLPNPSSSSSYNLSSAIRFLLVNLSCAPRQVILLSFLWVPARFAILLFSILFADILDSSPWLLPLCLSFLSYYNFIYDVYFPCTRLSDSLSSDIQIFLYSEILFNIKKK